jgi:hypothetical protein
VLVRGCGVQELLDVNQPEREKWLQLYQRLWANGEPIIVRGAKTGKVPWTPDCMTRACREKNQAGHPSIKKNTHTVNKNITCHKFVLIHTDAISLSIFWAAFWVSGVEIK